MKQALKVLGSLERRITALEVGERIYELETELEEVQRERDEARAERDMALRQQTPDPSGLTTEALRTSLAEAREERAEALDQVERLKEQVTFYKTAKANQTHRCEQAEADRDKLLSALVGMCIQYLTVTPEPEESRDYREFHHMFMSAGEQACDVLVDMGLAVETPVGATLTKQAYSDWWRE